MASDPVRGACEARNSRSVTAAIRLNNKKSALDEETTFEQTSLHLLQTDSDSAKSKTQNKTTSARHPRRICCVTSTRKRKISDAVRPTATATRRCPASDSISSLRNRKIRFPTDAKPKQKPHSSRKVTTTSLNAIRGASIHKVSEPRQGRTRADTTQTT